MKRKFKTSGLVIIVAGVALILITSCTHMLDVPLQAPETQLDRDDQWEYDATAYRQMVAFFIGVGIIAIGIYVGKRQPQQLADTKLG